MVTYDPQAPVPELPRIDKIRIGRALYDLYYDEDGFVAPMEGAIHRYIAGLTEPERKYAHFWISRERANPFWRREDKQRALPMEHTAKILQFKPRED